MTGDLPEAAIRLASELPSRTHEWSPPKHPTVAGRERVITGKGRGGNNRKPITLMGRTFATVKEARETLKIGNGTIRDMLKDGRAVRG